ncbi:MAG: hypothetical protein RI958_1549 [Actinomycetota bacterium]
MTGSAPERSFRVWVRSALGVTIAASGASVVGTFVLAATLGAAHSVTRRNEPGEWISWGPIDIDRPDSTVIILVMAALLMTLASVVQSLLRAFDAVVVRRRLRQFTAARRADRPLSARTLMAERYLLEGWTRWVSGLVQALAYSVLLVMIAGPTQLIGLLGVVVLVAATSLSFFRRARDASLHFLAAQRQANAADMRRRRRNGNDDSAADDYQTLLLGVSDAVYRRDTQAFRLAAVPLAVLSVGSVVCVVVPAFLTVGDSTLTLFLITLFIWRARVIELVSSVGHFTWTLCLWRDAGAEPALHEAGDAAMADMADLADFD